jgi:hypothetical protein
MVSLPAKLVGVPLNASLKATMMDIGNNNLVVDFTKMLQSCQELFVLFSFSPLNTAIKQRMPVAALSKLQKIKYK